MDKAQQALLAALVARTGFGPNMGAGAATTIGGSASATIRSAIPSLRLQGAGIRQSGGADAQVMREVRKMVRESEQQINKRRSSMSLLDRLSTNPSTGGKILGGLSRLGTFGGTQNAQIKGGVIDRMERAVSTGMSTLGHAAARMGAQTQSIMTYLRETVQHNLKQQTERKRDRAEERKVWFKFLSKQFRDLEDTASTGVPGGKTGGLNVSGLGGKLGKFGRGAFGGGLMVGSIYELWEQHQREKNEGRRSSFFGDETTGGFWGSRAGKYLGAAGGGAATGAGIGALIPGLGETGISEGIGAIVGGITGLVSAVYTDYKEEIDQLTDKTLAKAKSTAKNLSVEFMYRVEQLSPTMAHILRFTAQVFGDITDWVNNDLPGIVQNLESKAVDITQRVCKAIHDVIGQIGESFEHLTTWFDTTTAQIKDTAGAYYHDLDEKYNLTDKASFLWDAFKTGNSLILGWLESTTSDISALVTKKAKELYASTGAQEFVDQVWGQVQGTFDQMKNWFSDALDATVGEAWRRIKGYATKTWEGTSTPSPPPSASVPGPQSSASDVSRLATVNNNPGNLRFVGQSGAIPGEGGFASFPSMEAGYNALKKQIALDSRRGLTLGQYIAKFAPPNENDTATYIAQAAKSVGATPDTPLSQINPETLAQFQARKESNYSVPSVMQVAQVTPLSAGTASSAAAIRPDDFQVLKPPPQQPEVFHLADKIEGGSAPLQVVQPTPSPDDFEILKPPAPQPDLFHLDRLIDDKVAQRTPVAPATQSERLAGSFSKGSPSIDSIPTLPDDPALLLMSLGVMT